MTTSTTRKLGSRLGSLLAGAAETAAVSGAARARRAASDIRNGGRFSCSCGGKGCPGSFRSLRAQKAHAAKVTSTRWMSGKARAAGRKMGKETDNLRRHALGWLEAAGLREWKSVPVRDKDGKPVERNGRAVTREIPVQTDRARSRPEVRGRATRGQLRELHKHDRDHEHAGRHDEKAGRHRAKGRDAKADAREGKAADLRARWTEPRPARPAPDDGLRELLGRAAAHAENGNGTRPAPARTGRSPRT